MTEQFSISALFKRLAKSNIICAYHGEFNYEIVNGLLKSAKQDLDAQESDKKAAIKTYKVLVECLENIHKHSAGQPDEGIFILSHITGGFDVKIGNLILSKDTETLESQINNTNSMNREELKSKYKEIIQNGSISSRGGAGLGLLDIALKSGSKLNYHFYEYDSTKHFFTMELQIKPNN